MLHNIEIRTGNFLFLFTVGVNNSVKFWRLSHNIKHVTILKANFIVVALHIVISCLNFAYLGFVISIAIIKNKKLTVFSIKKDYFNLDKNESFKNEIDKVHKFHGIKINCFFISVKAIV